MSKRAAAVSALALALLAAAVPAHAQFPRVAPRARTNRVELYLNSWNPTPDLVLGTGGSDTVDLVKTFGLEKQKFKVYGAKLGAGKSKVRLQRLQMNFEQATTVTQTFTFDGRTYPVSLPASLTMNWKLTRAGYEFDAVNSPAGYLGVIGEVKYNQIKASIAATGVGTSAVDTTAPIPAVGVAGGGYLVPRRLSMDFEVSGFKLPQRTTREGRFVDYDLHATAHLGPLGVQAGYRSIDVNYLVDADRGTLKMKGPYVGASLRF